MLSNTKNPNRIEEFMSKKDKTTKSAIAGGQTELIQRSGNANAEYIKAYRGVDNQTGKILNRSLKNISQGKLHPDFATQNLKQQAGFSAEVAMVADGNADAIMKGRSERISRSEDVKGYGANNNVVDIVEINGGKVISHSQMKFVSNPEALIDEIATGKFVRYQTNDHLDLPSEQVDKARSYCDKQIDNFSKQADALESRGELELATQKREASGKYQKIKSQIRDSGLTTDDAINLRKNPLTETTIRIAKNSHRSGVEGAQIGAAIGGAISIITNIIAVRSGDKDFYNAVVDVASDTAKTSIIGYGTAFSGGVIKGVMQQSTSGTLRAISKTNLPAIVVTTCLSLAGSIKKLATQENFDIDDFFVEVGQSGSNMISSAAFATLGQIAIPIPILGGMIGGMVGHTVSNLFYHSFTEAINEKKLSRERYQYIKEHCEISIKIAEEYRLSLDAIFNEKIKELGQNSTNLFNTLRTVNISSDEFCDEINLFAQTLGKELQFKNYNEFDDFMNSDQPLII